MSASQRVESANVVRVLVLPTCGDRADAPTRRRVRRPRVKRAFTSGVGETEVVCSGEVMPHARDRARSPSAFEDRSRRATPVPEVREPFLSGRASESQIPAIACIRCRTEVGMEEIVLEGSADRCRRPGKAVRVGAGWTDLGRRVPSRQIGAIGPAVRLPPGASRRARSSRSVPGTRAVVVLGSVRMGRSSDRWRVHRGDAEERCAVARN